MIASQNLDMLSIVSDLPGRMCIAICYVPETSCFSTRSSTQYFTMSDSQQDNDGHCPSGQMYNSYFKNIIESPIPNPQSRVPKYPKDNKLQDINAKLMARTLGVQEAEDYILDLLKAKGKMTTSEVYKISQDNGVRCPDETVKFLNKMRLEGKINGEVSIEAKSWIWSARE